MPRFGPVSYREFVRYLRALGFDGPYPGSKQPFMTKGGHHYTITNPHGEDIGPKLLARLLRQLGISRDEWEAL